MPNHHGKRKVILPDSSLLLTQPTHLAGYTAAVTKLSKLPLPRAACYLAHIDAYLD